MEEININYKSDFKLRATAPDGSALELTPFRLTYYTSKQRGTHVAEYDGKKFTNCYPDGKGGIIIPIRGEQLGRGTLWVDTHLFFTDSDFKNGICNYRSTKKAGVLLGDGVTDDMTEIVVDVFPFYQQGKSAYDIWLEEGNEGTIEDFLASLKGEPFEYEDFTQEQLDSLKGPKGDTFTYDDLTDEQKKDLAYQVIGDAEDKRRAAEAIREEQEIEREQAEALRKQAEEARENTFAANESARQDAFDANEAIREENETSRQDAEVIREENEKRREETYKNKVDRDDKAPKLTAGFANNLVGRGEATPQEISFRPSGGDTSIEDGTARIERVKGSTLVWNQYAPVDLSSYILLRGSDKTYTDGIRTVTSTTANSTSYVYKNASEIIPSRLGRIIYGFAEVKAESTNSEIFIIGAGNTKFIPATGDWQKIETIGKVYVWSGAAIGAGVRVKDEMVTWSIRQLKYYDLTQMFGEGNEPATIEEFHARKPKNIDEYAYNEGELISNNAEELKSVGCNAFNGEYAKVLGGKQYELLGTYTSVGFTKELGGEVAAIEIPSDKMYTPNENGYIYAQGSDICIHLTHTGYKNGRCEEYWAMTRTIPIKDIKDNDGNQLFPNGLLSAGSAHDEITATKAIKRVGVVDLGSLSYTLNAANRYYYSDCFMQANYTDLLNNLACSHYITKHWGGAGGFTLNYAGDRNTCVAIWKGNTTGLSQVNILDDSVADAAELMAMLKEKDVMLYYELAEPIEVDLPEPLNLDYEVSDFGTEEVLSSEPTTLMKADIIYQFNAVDRIRDNSRHTAEADKKLLDYESRIAALEAIAASLTSSES